MSVTIETAATATQLTTLDRVQAEMGLASGTDDDVLSDMIDRATSAISRETRRVFGIETVTETLDGTNTRLLQVSRAPIIEIGAVVEDGTTLDAAEYSIEDAEAGALYRFNGWGRSGGLLLWGAEAFASGYILPGYQDRRYSVTYTAGYLLPDAAPPSGLSEGALGPDNLPGAVEQACLETVKAWYQARTTGAENAAGAVSSVQIGPVRVGYGSGSRSSSSSGPGVVGSLPPSALGLLRNYYARAATP